MSFKLKYFFIIALVMLQLSFFKGLGWPWFNVNFLIGIAVFWIMYSGLEKNLLPIIIGSLILDLFGAHIFGTIIFAVLFTCYLLNLIYLHFFTNQSFLSLFVLGAIGLFFYNFFIAIFYYFFYWINKSNYSVFIDGKYWLNLMWQTVFVAINLTIFYMLSNVKFTKK